FVVVSFCMAELYDVAITPNWVFITILTCFLLGVSSPPVAGGAVVCFAVLFRQLGIPEEAIGFALAINILFDFILTAVNIYCLDMELIRLSSSLKMLDKKVLREKESGI
ncbi:cation:dicarboxylase symporter family transporter, partial [Candidatus Saccharibacteria bacterium]|nr:cation:dicarboxylase symporter family transporter [Candidatus Saccharibacteria bacterium]